MKKKTLIVSTGLAMFSMFFGSGNLVFPLIVGKVSEGAFPLAALGILMTGVLVPFMGILAMLLFDGSTKDFFGRLGKPVTFWFSLFALSLMGPFGVLPRCLTVAHGAFKLLSPTTPIWVFSLVSCLLIFLLSLKRGKIVPLLGSILTPILLISLVFIAIFGLASAPFPTLNFEENWSSFKVGILQGYQTMDLLAAFFFSSFVIKHLKDRQKKNDSTKVIPIFFKASLIGAFLLASIYFVLVILGASYAPMLQGIPPEEMLGTIAKSALGVWAAPVICCAVIFACLTTAIVLTSLFANFFQKEVAKGKVKSYVSLLVTLGTSFAVSTLEFSGIARIIQPILEAIYPALIILTLFSIFYKVWGFKTVRVPFALTFIAKLLSRAI